MAEAIVPFSECTSESWEIGGVTIERRHHKGWPCTSEHFVYSVTATWEELSGLGVCGQVNLPDGRKRTSYGNLGDWESWSLKARRGKRRSLTLRVDERIQILERLIAREKLNAMPQRGHLRLVWSATQ